MDCPTIMPTGIATFHFRNSTSHSLPECSNRIEGVTAPLQRIKDLVALKTTPSNRSEQEIAGYRDVLATIHANADAMPFSANMILQLHRDLYQFLPGEGGAWKPMLLT